MDDSELTTSTNTPPQEVPNNASTTSLAPASQDPRLIDLPQHAKEEAHQTLEVTLPANQTSHGQVEQFELQPVGKHEKVRGHIVKDKQTGRHYKKVFKRKTPAYSLGHAKGAPIVKVAPKAGASFGLGHAFASTEARGKVDPQREHHHHNRNRNRNDEGVRQSQDSMTRSPAIGQAEKEQLFQEIRAVIIDQMKAGNGSTTIIQQNQKGNGNEKDGKAGRGTPSGEIGDKSKSHNLSGDGTPAQGSNSNTKKNSNASESQDTKAEMELNADGEKTVMRNQKVDDHESLTTRSSFDSQISSSTCSSDDDDEDNITFPNPWAKFRYLFREELAEAMGTFVLLTFGNAVDCQVLLADALLTGVVKKGDYLSIAFGWGIGVGMGVWVSGGISGGHLNPVVTLALAIFRGFPWKKVPRFWIAQLFGGWLGALCVYGCYINPLRMVDPGKTSMSAAFFTTYPAEFLLPEGARISAFFNEVYGTAILLMVILAIGDSNNVAPVDGMAPLVLLWLITGIGSVFGYQTAYAINPARDLGPRLMLWTVGYGTDVWTYGGGYFAYTPLLGSIVGAILGAFMYDAFIYTGSESPLNKQWGWSSVTFWRRFYKKKPKSIENPSSIEDGKYTKNEG